MFRKVFLSIIRSTALYTQQQVHVNIIEVMLCVQCWTPDDGQKNCPKHVEFYSKNKFEKLVYLVGFIIRIRKYSDVYTILKCEISWASV
jgi:hypothetical protein